MKKHMSEVRGQNFLSDSYASPGGKATTLNTGADS